MADQSDVETALVSAITAMLYPNGSSSAGLLAQTVKIYRGWPNTASLRTDLAARTLNVTVFPLPHTSRNTTRWAEGLIQASTVTPSLTVSVSGTSATFAGSADTGQLAGLLVDQLAVVHRTVTADTPELVAASLAQLICTQRIALASGATVTVPGAALLLGRVVADQPVLRWTRSQLQQFRDQLLVPGPGLARQRCRGDRRCAVVAQLSLPSATAVRGGCAMWGRRNSTRARMRRCTGATWSIRWTT